MTHTLVEQRRVHRPWGVVALISVLFFLGVTALAGGIAMTFGLGGEQVMVPEDWLAGIPIIDSWVIPGMVLGLVFGVGSLVTGYGVLRRPEWAWTGRVERAVGQHWSWIATVLLGAGHLIWIGLELLYLPTLSWLQPVYGLVGLLLIMLPFLPSVRRHLETG